MTLTCHQIVTTNVAKNVTTSRQKYPVLSPHNCWRYQDFLLKYQFFDATKRAADVQTYCQKYKLLSPQSWRLDHGSLNICWNAGLNCSQWLARLLASNSTIIPSTYWCQQCQYGTQPMPCTNMDVSAICTILYCQHSILAFFIGLFLTLLSCRTFIHEAHHCV